jgi:preprotein translocase subunit Sec63
MALQALLPKAVEEQWSTGKLAEEAGVHYVVAQKFMSKVANQGERKAVDKVLRVADSYRSTRECTAARSREYLETIEDKALSELTANERQLRREALASLTTIGGLLKFSEPAADRPEKLGNL